MKTVFAASAALAAVLFAGSPASAEITVDSARAIHPPNYKAHNAQIVKNKTTTDIVGCSYRR